MLVAPHVAFGHPRRSRGRSGGGRDRQVVVSVDAFVAVAMVATLGAALWAAGGAIAT
jgi:hypothetical protein